MHALFTCIPAPSVTVSGFYAECLPKRMYVNGSIYTKSKFLGLSLGVHNIGSGEKCRGILTLDLISLIGPGSPSFHTVLLKEILWG